MVKSRNGETPKASSGETKTRRAPARRAATRKPAPPLEAAVRGSFESGTEALPQPNPEDVRRRAYEIYVRRGGTHGADLDDWYEAERELRDRTH